MKKKKYDNLVIIFYIYIIIYNFLINGRNNKYKFKRNLLFIRHYKNNKKT